mmetsp:Transcript_49058/g.122949  ORF Transcript_49058/g.122949 Transcript_49058/m.122949 type:complete len:84 (-) Transcript_49058:1072-1323(-)
MERSYRATHMSGPHNQGLPPKTDIGHKHINVKKAKKRRPLTTSHPSQQTSKPRAQHATKDTSQTFTALLLRPFSAADTCTVYR